MILFAFLIAYFSLSSSFLSRSLIHLLANFSLPFFNASLVLSLNILFLLATIKESLSDSISSIVGFYSIGS
jgi:hypothetical protein